MSLGEGDFHFKSPGGGKGTSRAPFKTTKQNKKSPRKGTYKNNNSIHIVCLNVYCLMMPQIALDTFPPHFLFDLEVNSIENTLLPEPAPVGATPFSCCFLSLS